MQRVLAVSLFSSLVCLGFACSSTSGTPLSSGGPLGGDTGAGGTTGNTSQTAQGGTTQTSTVSASIGGSTAISTSQGASSQGSGTTSSATTTGSPTGGSGGAGTTCRDVPPDDRETTCAQWAAYGECDNPNGWLDAFCDASCGRCNGSATGTGGTAGDASGGVGGVGSGSGAGGASDGSTNTTGVLGNDNPYSPIQGGTNGFSTRYWDCCKPSCGWEGNANPVVVSCDVNDGGRSANDTQNGCETNGQSGAFTCHSMAPWAYSTVVSYGFAAVNGVGCGTCFQVEFTGTSQRGGNDAGSAALAGKTMIIMATNIGGIEQNQFDILIPGGGVGLLNGCAGQWGVNNDELGAQYGGFLSVCRDQNWEDHDATKSCVRQKCESVFGSRGLDELYAGCMWFVDWFEAADNPDIRFQQIQCPQELTGVAY